MKALQASDFGAFSRAVHGHDPFPWQMRLLEQLAGEGRWPEVLDLPTGTGKTTAIDLALFHLALEAGRADRRAPVRILLVVDRRTIVDQAYDRAERIKRALDGSSDPVVRSVRQRLESLSRVARPLHVALMRGGIVRDDAWARTPDQPTIALSTVDQVGSRLLFRGYGVSDSMKPIHAGLLGNDALFLLDEVHLAEPFCQTLTEIARFRKRPWMERELLDRWQVVRMSATTLRRKGAFSLSKEDERHPVLSRRLRAAKPAELRDVRVTGQDDTRAKTYAEALAKTAIEHAKPGVALAVVVNRIATAHMVHAEISRLTGDGVDTHLLTGRMRPRERAALEKELRPRIAAGRERNPEARAAVLVSTQCIEAGADYDFDVLITECASLDALRQRFGRLNRLGDLETCRGYVFARLDLLSDDDPIYGSALAATWKFLRGLPEVDFGIRRLELPEGEELAGLVAETSDAPVLLPAHLDAWAQTEPRPEPDPDPSLWLHGKGRVSEPEVQVCWRADIEPDALELAVANENAADALRGIVEACPPSAGELVSVTRRALQRWLSQAPADDVLSDVEGARTPEPEERGRTRDRGESRPFFLWRGDDSATLDRVTAEDGSSMLRPGDTVVVPVSYGGLRGGNWSPDERSVVRDIATEAHVQHRGRLVWRLHEQVVKQDLLGETSETLAGPLVPPTPSDAEDADHPGRLTEWLETVRDAPDVAEPVRKRATAFAEALQKRARILRFGSGGKQWFVLVARRKDSTADFATSEGDSGSFTGEVVTLAAHLEGVGDWARSFATGVGLPPEVVADLELAGRLHDLGKADSRFQRMLHGGSEFSAAVATEPIAKSAIPQNDRAAREAARRRSGYPRGARHELQSLALVQDVKALRARAADWDLVLHLVASHHGYCRPLAPVVPDEALPVLVETGGLRLEASSAHALHRLDSGVADRFWLLVRRYGWFQLAWLEAVLRLADHRRSEQEQRGLR